MRTVGLMVGLFMSMALIPTVASAQGSIAGVVRDTSGAVLPGVTVEATSPALIERVRSVVTDGSGQYRIENLRPGSYAVTFTLTGFAVARREGIALTGTFTATVNAELRVGTLEETVTVSGESPTVDVQNTTRQAVMSREVLDTIPFGRADRDLTVLIPGVSSSRVDVGGSQTVVSGSAAVHGGDPNDQRITLNGLSAAVPFTGSSSSQGSNMAALQEVTVDTAAVDSAQETGGVRINLIPRDGGNTFKGSFFGTFATNGLQSDNYTQDLKDRGLRTPDQLKRIFDVNPGFGGPVKKDTVWFFLAARYNGTSQYPGGILYNLNANNPAAWTYAPDTTRRPSVDSTWKDLSARLTWQATPKHKVGLFWDEQTSCYCSEGISATLAPETADNRHIHPLRNIAADWTAPITSRLLFEAGALRRLETPARDIPPTNPLMIAVTDQALGNLTYRTIPGVFRTVVDKTFFYRSAVSYVTGAHAFKAGISGGLTSELGIYRVGTQPVNYRFNNGVPNQITLFPAPYTQEMNLDPLAGLYAQDRWTTKRLTLSYGVRYDYYRTSFDAQHLGPGPLVPTRDITLPATSGVSLHDIAPKSGVSYDIFGNGKTAVKMSLNKYLQGMAEQGPFGSVMTPASLLVNSTTRSWNDANRNFVPECEILNPLANGECGAMANSNFGSAVPGATYDPDTLTGWGKRGYNWEFSAGLQHEVVPHVSVDMSYFRRWYGNFIVTDDLSVAPSDFTAFTLPTPTTDSRLPGAGSTISGLYNVTPAKFGVPSQNYVTFASNYGKQSQHWNGIDLLVNARPRAGVVVQGGLSAGRTSFDNCEVVAKLPESLLSTTVFGVAAANVWLPSQFCHMQEKFLTQVKFLGSYTIPRVDVQVSGSLQSIPGPLILANYTAPNAVVAPSLGRNLSGNAANMSIELVAPGTMYGERKNQLDLRFGKILRFGRARSTVSVDFYNALNANAVLAQSNVFATWQTPQSILLARFVKLGMQFDF